MKSQAKPCAIGAIPLLLASAWALGGPAGEGQAPAPAAVAARAAGPVQGLGPQQLEAFFHLSEGIELVPLSWIKALRSVKTGRPFLEFPERFGLLPDPANADGLPIGITASPSRGAEYLGPMVGLNCAACHVGGLTFGGQTLPILGGPALYDLNAFYQELFGSVGVMLQDDGTRQQFLADLAKQGDVDAAILAQQVLAAAAVASQLGGQDLKATADLFQTRLLTIVRKLVADAEAKLGGQPPTPTALAALQQSISKQIGALIARDALGLVALVLTPATSDDPVDLARKANTDPILAAVLKDLDVELSLTRARLTFVGGLQQLHAAQRPLPGPGRIDAFDGIRDLVFPPSDGIPADSPVSFPALWMINQTFWLHWDGNTNSVIERNVGQALGQGAPFQPAGQGHYHSKVQPENIHRLEEIVRTLTPPDWPAALFGPIDQARAARGKAIYQARCITCHTLAPRDGHDVYDALKAAQAWARNPQGGPPAGPSSIPEKLIPIAQVGTDPARAMNFATSVGRTGPRYAGGTDFAVALGQAAWGYTEQSYIDNGIAPGDRLKFDWPRQLVRWQTSRSYVARPLISIWATAPYLHNASVPTIYHLLLPAKDRPKLFFVGQRQYDPIKLGFVIDPARIPPEQIPLLFEFNATASGNLNIGHEGPAYGTDLDDDGRHDLIEYLKTL